MNAIDNFMMTYPDERSQWGCLKDRAIDMCVAGLDSIGVMDNVTGRVKSAGSPCAKLKKRHSLKAYSDGEAIMDDQLDFVGLRIVLYFLKRGYVIAPKITNNVTGEDCEVVGKSSSFGRVALEELQAKSKAEAHRLCMQL
ncbi:hypothetical protein B0J13DRAFT_616339 [Dactylonectria estremocensis]|uniref:Uncharacterized protein n=1 Tax=Dactylonectria estremocensis TaxID=1079267 RepID=A0A9P9FDK5_9HYPO|nr:hypothetical protein B0J13DRAFT_616339 [Dactylonectria estremocensis]